MTILYSVVVAARNAQGTLEMTLDSLLSQSDDHWEAFIVDDRSTDGTGAIANAYAARDPRFSVLLGRGEGVSKARNLGLAQAKGRRLLFLDSDDWVAPTFLEALGGALDANPEASAAFCAYQRVTPNGNMNEPQWSGDLEWSGFEVMARRCGSPIHTILVDRQLIVELGGFEEALLTCEDWDLWQRVARTGARFVGVKKTLAFYRISADSLSRDVRPIIADAATVIARGFSTDARVLQPAPAHASGADPAHGSTELALSFFTLWCAAFEAARRNAIEAALAAGRLVDLKDNVGHAVEVMFEALLVGARCSPSELVAQWPEIGNCVSTLLEQLEARSSRPGLKRRLQYGLERRILIAADLMVPSVLGLTALVPFDISQPTAISGFPNVDRLFLAIHATGQRLRLIEMPMFERLSANDGAKAALHSLGLRTFILKSRTALRPRAWLAGSIALVRGLPRYIGRRDKAGLRVLARDTFLAAVLSHIPRASATDKDQTLFERIVAAAREEVRSGGGACSAPGVAIEFPAARAVELDRRGYWDEMFARPDPWDYGSAYEQLKYERTLSLVPRGVRHALELACAEGRFTAQLASLVGHLTASDISQRALDRARVRCAGLSNVNFARLDLVTDPLPTDLDLIVCSEVLYYLNDREELAVACRRLRDTLRPNGHLLSAHAFLLIDDLGRTAFDWENHPYGAALISEVMTCTPGLTLESSIQTDLYRIDLFCRAPPILRPPPRIEHLPIGAPLHPDVARNVIWGGAEIRRADARSRERTNRLPILMYHRIADDGPPELARYRTKPEMFQAQMRWLRSHGYYTVSTEEAVQRIRSREYFPGRPVLITFDDGTADFHDIAWPILRDCDLSAQVFIVTDMVGGTAAWDAEYGPPAPLLNAVQIKALARAGVRFGSHLATHRAADSLSSAELAAELARSRAKLEAWTGSAVTAFAAPYGVVDERLLALAERCGYDAGFTARQAMAQLSDDPICLPRIEVRGDITIEQFADCIRESVDNQSVLVSVVIPAYNAESTIDETLRSVRTQTYRNLEILVVDDGSRDRTAEIVAAHVTVDDRVGLIRQPNGGVAEARNHGFRKSRGKFLAFVDADDLCAPTKIEKQVAALRDGGPRTGLVYTWSVIIDDGRVVDTQQSCEAGDVFERVCRGNPVGNGSAVLVTRAAFAEVGGFDTTLHACGAQGCEDWLFYLDVAERYCFAVVPELLTGYRRNPRSMSSDSIRMLRSYELVAERMKQRRPWLSAAITGGSDRYAAYLIGDALKRRHLRLAWLLLRRSSLRAAWHVASEAIRAISNPPVAAAPSIPAGVGSPFVIGDPGSAL